MLTALSWLLVVPVAGGTVYALLSAVTTLRFLRPRAPQAPVRSWPGVTILKPVHGLEKDLECNLRSACAQDYPGPYQVVMAVQRLNDPALSILERLRAEFGEARVTVVVRDSAPVVNGKIQNLCNALGSARHEVIVISDSDVHLPADYLRRIVAPLAASPGGEQIGYTCTLYRAEHAERWYEALELLTYNADFTPGVMFATQTGAASLCIGASVALRRSTLEAIGGLESLSTYLVEDYELGRRIHARGLRMELVPYFVGLTVDLASARSWALHQIYWDLNTKAANPVGFFLTVLTRGIPFAVLFALARAFDPLSLIVLAQALAVRLGSAAFIARCMNDGESLRRLVWLPVRDLAGLATWALAFLKRQVVWRGVEFELTRDGRIVPRTT